MQMNSNIPLSIQGVDVMGAIDRGTAAASNYNALRQQNALANVYRTQGAGIMAGDPGALNALAAFDPQAALGIQQTRQGMQADQQRMDMLSREEQRQIADHAAKMSAAERAEAAAQVESAVKAGLAIQDPQTWDAYMSQNAPDLVGQFGNRQMIANRYMSIADIIKGQAPADPTKGAPTGYAWADPANRMAGVKPLPGYSKTPPVQVNLGENSSAFGKKADEKAAERYDGIAAGGQSAQAFLGDLKALTDLAPSVGTGKGAQVLAAIGPYADALGVPIDGLGEAQAYQAIVDRLAPNMRPAGAGATSDFDAKQFLSSLPSLGRTPEGNALITQTLQALQENKVAAAEIANRVFSGEITWQQGDKEIAALGNPYAEFKKSRGGQSGATPSAGKRFEMDGYTVEALD